MATRPWSPGAAASSARTWRARSPSAATSCALLARRSSDLGPLDELEFERATGDVTDRRAVRRAMDGRRPGLPRRRAHLAARRPTARRSSTPTCAARGSSSRRRSRPGSSGSSTPRRVGAIGVAKPKRHRRRDDAVRDRPPRASPTSTPSTRPSSRRSGSPRTGLAGGDRQPDLRARPRRPDPDLDGPGAPLLPRPDPRLRRRRRSTSSTSATSPPATCSPTRRARSASATSSAGATSPSTACSPTSRGSPASRRRR